MDRRCSPGIEGTFRAWLLLHFVTACAHLLGLKRLVPVDCLFLSLACVKRHAELELRRIASDEKAPGRGRYTNDAPLIQTFGIAAGFRSCCFE